MTSRAAPSKQRANRQALKEEIQGGEPPALAIMPTGRGGGGLRPTNPTAETSHEAYRGAKWTVDNVRKVLKQHSIDTMDDFFADVGKRSSYSAKKVLDWLGY
jgi:hypothetical protein